MSSGTLGDAVFIGVRPGGRRVRAALLVSVGCALRVHLVRSGSLRSVECVVAIVLGR